MIWYQFLYQRGGEQADIQQENVLGGEGGEGDGQQEAGGDGGEGVDGREADRGKWTFNVDDKK